MSANSLKIMLSEFSHDGTVADVTRRTYVCWELAVPSCVSDYDELADEDYLGEGPSYKQDYSHVICGRDSDSP